jgi:hypothetical protein
MPGWCDVLPATRRRNLKISRKTAIDLNQIPPISAEPGNVSGVIQLTFTA